MKPRLPPQHAWLPLALAAFSFGCDVDESDFDASPRAYGNALPDDSALEENKGGPIFNCPKCGSAWTIDMGHLLIYLADDLGLHEPLDKAPAVFFAGNRKVEILLHQREPMEGGTVMTIPIAETTEDAPDMPMLASALEGVVKLYADDAVIDVRLNFTPNNPDDSAVPVFK